MLSVGLPLVLLCALPDGGALLPAPEPFNPKVDDPLLVAAPRAKRELSGWDEAQRLLKAQSTDDRIAIAAVQRAQGEWRQSLALLLPNARLTVQGVYDVLNPTVPLAGTVNPTVPLATAGVGATQAVFDWSAWRGLAQANAGRARADAELRDGRRRLTQGLARTLVAVVAAERIAELNRIGLQQALERAALTERTRQLGAATQVDVVRTQQDVEVARGTLIAGDEQLRRTREALGLAVGADEEVGVAAGFSLAELADETARACPVVPWETRPDLQAARAAADAAAESRRKASAGHLPVLGLSTNLFAHTSTGPDAVRFASWSIAAVLTLPLFEGGGREGLVAERRGAEQQAVEAIEARRRSVSVEVARARRAVGVAEALVGSADKARATAAQLDQLTRRSFEVGRGSSVELVQSAAALRLADVALATREFELVTARLDALLTEASCDW